MESRAGPDGPPAPGERRGASPGWQSRAARSRGPVSRPGSRASTGSEPSTASGSLRSRRPSHPRVAAATASWSGASRARAASGGQARARSARAAAMICARAAAAGRPSSTTRSARDRKASSTADAKLVVVTTTVPGRVAARWSSPASTASVARCTSTGLVSKEARLRRTAKLSTSSITTTTCGRAPARDGTTSRSSRTTFRWLSPSISPGRACGSTSMSVVAPRGATASAAAWASPRASVVFPVPGGPASTMSPLGTAAAGSADRRLACSIATSAVPSKRSRVPAGTTRACHGPSW